MEVQPGEDPSVLTRFDRVFVRQNLTCDMPIEVPYYSSKRFALICTSCGCTSDAIIIFILSEMRGCGFFHRFNDRKWVWFQ